MRALRIAAAALPLLLPAAARAGCVWSDLVTEEARAAAVRPGAPRVNFVQDDVLARGCPNESAACRARAYLTPGDVVLTGPTQGAYTCAGFVGARGATTIGWMPSAALLPLPEAEQVPADWNGQWTAPEQDIAITPGGKGALRVKGEATWGMGDPERVRRGGIHTGEVAGEARPVNGVLAFSMGDDDTTKPYEAGDEYTCRIRLWRRGPYLLARDNNGCGGLNVSFSGFYRRKG
ncbi:hypothetical protein [Roseomonas indoligenes]|uniref:SH3 domain-containing protein n=1 Tax=Roseomonas indoligenes TaxID=2820811 RepID=A0A940S5C9_9PROT|nr:hypothetical protein [Pararoseomonas indoligenes]MBP0494261.1 hypothetical protein [Pararoseomonas indoligenes]